MTKDTNAALREALVDHMTQAFRYGQQASEADFTSGWNAALAAQEPSAEAGLSELLTEAREELRGISTSGRPYLSILLDRIDQALARPAPAAPAEAKSMMGFDAACYGGDWPATPTREAGSVPTLSDEQITALAVKHGVFIDPDESDVHSFARAILAATNTESTK